MDWGARPPRVLFGAPLHRTLKHTGKPAKDAIGEGADGYSRGGCAPLLPSSILYLCFHFHLCFQPSAFTFRYFFIQPLAFSLHFSVWRQNVKALNNGIVVRHDRNTEPVSATN